MSGGSWEYTMGNISTAVGSYTFYPSSSSFSSTWYTTNNNAKYITTYAYGTAYNDQTAYNRGRLGDATGEVVSEVGSSAGLTWYSNYADFPYSSNAWFVRGCYYGNSSYNGMFTFDGASGYNYSISSSHAALISLS